MVKLPEKDNIINLIFKDYIDLGIAKDNRSFYTIILDDIRDYISHLLKKCQYKNLKFRIYDNIIKNANDNNKINIIC
jgi:hypothetical protein